MIFFYLKKIIFEISMPKLSKTLKKLIFSKKINFFKNMSWSTFPNTLIIIWKTEKFTKKNQNLRIKIKANHEKLGNNIAR